LINQDANVRDTALATNELKWIILLSLFSDDIQTPNGLSWGTDTVVKSHLGLNNKTNCLTYNQMTHIHGR
jgi:hypothetical protein